MANLCIREHGDPEDTAYLEGFDTPESYDIAHFVAHADLEELEAAGIGSGKLVPFTRETLSQYQLLEAADKGDVKLIEASILSMSSVIESHNKPEYGASLGKLHSGYCSIMNAVVVKVTEQFNEIEDLKDYVGKTVILADEEVVCGSALCSIRSVSALVKLLRDRQESEEYVRSGVFIFDTTDDKIFLCNRDAKDVVENDAACLVEYYAHDQYEGRKQQD